MKICYWDLETTRLEGQMGQLLCGSVYSSVTDTMITFRQDINFKNGKRKKFCKSMADDKELAIQIRDYLETHNLHIAYYGKGFDVPFLNTRLAYHGERQLSSLLMVDPCWAFRGWRGLATQNGKLGTVAEFFGFEQKPSVSRQIWLDAQGGDTEAMDILVDRCEADVRILKQITEKALDIGLIKNVQRYP